MSRRKNIGENGQFSESGEHNKHNVQPDKRRKEAPKYLTPEEIQALLNASSINARDHAIFRLAYHHGLRVSEVGLIQMRDYHPSTRKDYDRLVIDRLKGSYGGDTVLVGAAADAIRKWVKKRGQAPGPMFISRNRGRIGRTMLHYLMKRYCKLAGIPEEKAHFHALKHTCGTIMLSVLKESIVDVQHHLGHADIRSTMVYAKLTEQANEERAARLKNWR
jgi:integrase